MPPTEEAVQTTSTETPAPGDWRTHLTDELKADPVVSKWSATASEKDIPALIKGYAHTFTKQGNAINLPGKDAKPEEMAALKTKLYEAGVFQAPPNDPKEYGLANPGNLPKGVVWSDDLAAKFSTALHKHGIPKSALADLMPLYLDAVAGQVKSMQVDFEKGVAQLKGEHGEKYEERLEMVKRMMPGIFKTQEEIDFAEQTGLADHPLFLGPMLRLAPLAMQDSSFMETLAHKGGEITAEDAKAEYQRMMTDPTHPMYEDFKHGGKKSNDYINDFYRRAVGNAPVKIGEGVSV